MQEIDHFDDSWEGSDTLAVSADFDGCDLGCDPVASLAMYWAIARFDVDIQNGGHIVVENEPNTRS